MFLRMSASAPPRNKTPWGRLIAAFPVLFSVVRICSRKAKSPFFVGGMPNSKRLYSSLDGSNPVRHALFENGGFAPTKTKGFRGRARSFIYGGGRQICSPKSF